MRSFKKGLRVVLVTACVLAVLVLLDLALYPCTYIRNDVHTITTRQVDDIYLGTSHGKININPGAIQEVIGRTGHNMANGNEYPVDSYQLLHLMLEKGTAPSRVVYVTTPEYFTMEKEEGDNYLLFYHEFPLSRTKLGFFLSAVAKTNLRSLFFPWYEYPLGTELKQISKTFRKKVTKDYSVDDLKNDSQEYHEDGYIERYPVDPSTFSFSAYTPFSADNILPENLEWLHLLIRLCQENDIEFVAISTPQAQQVLDRYGESFAAAHAYFADFYEKEQVLYIDFNADPYYNVFTHKVSAFTDLEGHMHGDAAADFSRILAQVLEKETGKRKETGESNET